MKHIITFLFLLITSLNSFAATLESQVGKFSSYKLDNGLKVILLPLPSETNTGVIMTIKAGSKHEGYGETGMAHLLEHMLFKSTPNHPDIKETLNKLGAEWNGNTTPDRTTYYETFYDTNGDKLDAALKLEAERLNQATFEKIDLDKEMTVVRNELERNENSANTQLYQAVLRNTFTWHGYGHSTIGERTDIELAPFSSLQAFYKKHYRPDNAFIVIYGKFDTNSALELVEKHFSSLKNPKEPTPTTWTQEPAQKGWKHSEVTILDKKGGGIITWKMPPSSELALTSAEIAVIATTKNPYGKIYKKFVEQDKKAIAVQAEINQYRDYSFLSLAFSANANSNNKKITEELANYYENYITSLTEKDFNLAKTEYLNNTNKIFANPMSLGMILSESEVQGDWKLFFAKIEAEKKATLKEAKDILSKYLIKNNRSSAHLSFQENKQNISIPIFQKENVDKIAQQSFILPLKEALAFNPSIDNLKEKTIFSKHKNIHITHLQKENNGDLVRLAFKRRIGNEIDLKNKAQTCAMTNNIYSWGNKDLTKEQLTNKLESLEADVSISFNGFSISVPSKNLDKTLDLVVNTWQHPRFDKKEFSLDKQQLLTSYDAMLSEPAALISEKANSLFNTRKPDDWLYQRTILENKNNITKTTLQDTQKCHNELNGIAEGVLSVVGNIEQEKVVSIAENLQKWQSKIPYAAIKDEDIPTTNGIYSIKTPDKPNSIIYMGGVLPVSAEHEDFPALRIALKIFGGDSNSRIWQALREKNGLSYSAGANIIGNPKFNKTPVTIKVIASIENNKQALQLTQETWDAFVKNGVSQEEVVQAKKSFADEQTMNLTNDEGILATMTALKDRNKDYDWLISYNQKIQSLDAQRVNNIINKWLTPLNLVSIYTEK